jgi:DNA-binding NtrC family response regulator
MTVLHLTVLRALPENTGTAASQPFWAATGQAPRRSSGTYHMAKILCVDDEPHVVTLKCAILEAAGHDVTPSTSAKDAIEKLEHAHYDAVVTDWRLGDANGRAVVQAAKSHSSMPVVVVSGYVAEAFQAAEPLADLYLEKPVNPEELVTIVNELLKSGDKAATGS